MIVSTKNIGTRRKHDRRPILTLFFIKHLHFISAHKWTCKPNLKSLCLDQMCVWMCSHDKVCVY